MKEIKTIAEILREHEFYQHVHPNSDMIKCIKEYTDQVIDYISENIDADYNLPDESEFTKAHQIIEVYCLKGQFEEFKKLIK